MVQTPHSTFWRGWLLLAVALWMSFAPAAIAAGVPRFFVEPASVGGEESSAGPGLHIYLYGNGNPVYYADPTGYFSGAASLSELSAVGLAVGVLTAISIPSVRETLVSSFTFAASAFTRGTEKIADYIREIKVTDTDDPKPEPEKPIPPIWPIPVPLPLPKERRDEQRALIGETQRRVNYAHDLKYQDADRFDVGPIDFSNKEDVRTLYLLNARWVTDHMMKNHTIIDIGFDLYRGPIGDWSAPNRGPFYHMEYDLTRGYPKLFHDPSILPSNALPAGY